MPLARPLAVLAAAALVAVPAVRGQGLIGDGAAQAEIRTYRGRGLEVYSELAPDAARRVAAAAGNSLVAGATLFGLRQTPPIRLFTWSDASAWPTEELPDGPKFALRGGPPYVQTTWNSLTTTYSIAGVEYGREGQDERSAAVWTAAERGGPERNVVQALAAMALTDAPDWYVDGAAELARYHERGETAVRISPEDLVFLTAADRPALRATLEAEARPGDSLEDRNLAAYPWRWALAHVAAFNPNYKARYALLGPALANGQPVTFDGAFGQVEPQIAFEWGHFLDHLEQGVRPDLTAWDWNAAARPLNDRRPITARIDAGRGWQASNAAVTAGEKVVYEASGDWTVGPDEPRPAAADPLADPDPDAARAGRTRRELGDDLTAAGGPDGRGRLVAAVFDPRLMSLSDEIELSESGTFAAPAGGNLVLRCRDAWGQLDDNRGQITVKLTAAE